MLHEWREGGGRRLREREREREREEGGVNISVVSTTTILQYHGYLRTKVPHTMRAVIYKYNATTVL